MSTVHLLLLFRWSNQKELGGQGMRDRNQKYIHSFCGEI